MPHHVLRSLAVLAPLALVTLAGCSLEPSPDKLSPGAPGLLSTTVDNPESAPIDPMDYASEPVETGLLADMYKLGGYLYEPVDNWWNTRVFYAPVDPNSDEIIATIESYEATGGRLHPDFTTDSGIPYCVVDENTPLVPVSFMDPGESDAGAPGQPAGYPIPTAAAADPRYMENGGSPDGDRHLIVFDKDQRISFELVQASYANGQWSANYGAVFKLGENHRRPDGWTSADAAGMCILAGLVRYDEVYGPWPIRHALRCSIKRTNGHVFPASHTGSTTDGAPPLGTRLRLKKSFSLAGYPKHMRKILTCMKTYGLIVSDRGGNMYVHGTMDERWDNSQLNPSFYDLHVTDFEVIELGWKPEH